MAKKSISWKTKGMNRDTSVSAFNAEFAFENRNIRLSTNEGNTMMSWVNEKGTKELSLVIDTTPWAGADVAHDFASTISGTPIGTAVIDHKLVLFTVGDTHKDKDGNLVKDGDNIYLFEAVKDSDYTYTGKLLAHGNYNFDTSHPMETLVSYESKTIQKVYWTDYNNPLRMINVVATPKDGSYSEVSFDFKLPTSDNKECEDGVIVYPYEIEIEKIYGSGEFSAGVIQYAFTYFNKYGQETNIFYVTPLQYISFADRGGSPEDKVANSFKITFHNPVKKDHEYLRIYSIQRTSINATPFCKRLLDIKIDDDAVKNGITYMDTGINGDAIDPTELLYKSGNAVTCKTMEQKDGTLFLGGIKTIKSSLEQSVKKPFEELREDVVGGRNTRFLGEGFYDWLEYEEADIPSEEVDKVTETVDITEKIVVGSKLKTFKGKVISQEFHHINSINVSGFKSNEWYRVGVQFQDVMGNWSEPLYVTDCQIHKKPKVYLKDDETSGKKSGDICVPEIGVRLPYSFCKTLRNNGYTHARVLIAEPSANDRAIICQGIANPTVYQATKRFEVKKEEDGTTETVDRNKVTGALYGQPSWIFRPWNDSDDNVHSTTAEDGKGGYIPRYIKDVSAMDFKVISSEIFSDGHIGIEPSTADASKVVASPGLNSIELGGTMGIEGFSVDRNLFTIHSPEITFDESIYNKDWSTLKIRNVGHVTFGATYGDIDIQTKTPTIGSAAGFSGGPIKTSGDAALISGLYYEDYIVDDYYDDQNQIQYRKINDMEYPVRWPVYMWHHDGSLNNDCNRDNRTAELLKKKISNYHLFEDTVYDDTPEEYKTEDIRLFYSSELTLEKVNGHPYMGNIDTMVVPKKPSPKYFAKYPFPYGATMSQEGTYRDFLCNMDEFVEDYGLPKQTNDRCCYKLTCRRNVGDNVNVEKDDSYRRIYAICRNSGYGKWYNQWKDQEPKDPYGEEDDDENGRTLLKSIDPNVSEGNTTYPRLFKYDWRPISREVGDKVSDLLETSEGIRIKYKSTPHLVAQFGKLSDTDKNNFDGEDFFKGAGNAGLPLVEVYQDVNLETLYGGTYNDALKANVWIPVSEPYALNYAENIGESLEDFLDDKNIPESMRKDYSLFGMIMTSGWGDTYYQTYECLKTYAFTEEDKNQVVDIAAFLCETHVNIDGRYDRNRMQINNLNMSPRNFNLHNPVYSQLNNFFSYRMQDGDSYKPSEYNNTVTWSLTKQNGADVDTWTNITLASTLELDGDKGAISKLAKLNNQLFVFQDSGISQILYNEQTQVTSTEGVPIEIANSGKVQGKRYYSNTVGCSNPHSVVVTPMGIYFMDSNNKGIYLFNGELKDITTTGGFNSWAKNSIPSADVDWEPVYFKNFVTYYDQLNQEVLFINDKEALAYSEKFGCFTSFYDYGEVPYFCNLDDVGIWIRKGGLWQHQAGEYCNFFGSNSSFSMTLVGNQEPQIDKTFTNLEFRACVEGEGSYDENGKYSPSLPFDSLEVWNEYQHGTLKLTNRNSGDRFSHGTSDNKTWLNRKFRIWRCDMPRDNAPVNEDTEKPMGIKRFKARPLDRIRNPWVYIKLKKNAARNGYLSKTEVHDIVASYFG